MREIPGNEMVDLVALFAVLLIFFSIDIRGRTPDVDDKWHDKLFEWTSRIGGITTAVGVTSAWVNMFLAEDKQGFHVAWVVIPGSIAMACAIILGIEMVFARDKPGDKD